MKRELRCLYIDLDAEVFSWKTTDLPSTAADDAVVITTGVLAGTGSPVFDCLSIKEGGGPSSYCSGRIAAALRYAGADAVVIRGQLAKSRVLVLENGTGMLDDMPVNVENVEALKEKKLLVRRCMDFEGIDDGQHVRLAVKDDRSNQKFLLTLKEILTCAENR